MQESNQHTVTMSDIHERIKKKREEKGLTQEEFGKLVGVSYQSVQQWEGAGTKKTAPQRKRMQTVADVLGTTVQYLQTGSTSKDELDIDAIVEKLGAMEAEKLQDIMSRIYDAQKRKAK